MASPAITQLDPMLPVDTPKGRGWAFALIDYSQDHDTLYKVIVSATGEVWDVPQKDVRGVANWSMGRSPQSAQPQGHVADRAAGM